MTGTHGVGGWTVDLGVPGGAIVLPVDGQGDPGPWAHGTALERLGPQAPPELVDRLAEALADATVDARSRNPIGAFSFCPNPELGELARIELSNIDPDAEVPEISVRWLADYLATPTARSLNPPETVFGDLPIGPAVRVRHQYVSESAADGTEDDGTGSVLQTVAYAARPPQIGSAVLLMVSWHALAYSDQLFDLTDRLAETLKLVKRG